MSEIGSGGGRTGRGVKRDPGSSEDNRGSKKARAEQPDYEDEDDSQDEDVLDGDTSYKAGGAREKVPMTVQEKRERKRQINRLSAQRKRERERVQLDTLTDRYAQLSYMNEALKADNARLSKLLARLKDILATQMNRQEVPARQQALLGQTDEITKKLEVVELVRQALISAAQEGQPARLNSLDPATGSAAKTQANPFLQTTADLLEKLKLVDAIRDVLMSTLQSLQPAQLNISNLLSLISSSNSPAPQAVASPAPQAVAPPAPQSVVLPAPQVSAPLAPQASAPPVTDNCSVNEQAQQLLVALRGFANQDSRPNTQPVLTPQPVAAPSLDVTASTLLEYLLRGQSNQQ